MERLGLGGNFLEKVVGRSTSRGSPLLYVVSRAVRRVKFETILKYHEWYLFQISRTNHAIICYRLYSGALAREARAAEHHG